MNKYEQNSYGNVLMNVTEKLVSALVKKTDNYDSTNITLHNLGLEPASKYYTYIVHFICSYLSIFIQTISFLCHLLGYCVYAYLFLNTDKHS